jgi:hypothetical protein
MVMVFTLCAIGTPATAIVDTSIFYGDIDGDGNITTKDAQLALRVAAGLEVIADPEAFARGDINGDGSITVYDARQILRSCTLDLNLQPSGAFSGFEGYVGSGMSITTEDQAIAVFNALLNRIKTERAGFTRSEAVEVKLFDFEDMAFKGYNFSNETADSVSDTIKGYLVTEATPELAQTIVKGQNSDNAMSAETETYVSKLSANDVYGIRTSAVATEKGTTLTISIALADCELENIGQTAFDDVFNPAMIQESTNSVIENVFGSNTADTARIKEIKNAVLTVEIDTETAQVISYTTTYQCRILLKEATMGLSNILSAKFTNLEYITEIVVVYDQFSW